MERFKVGDFVEALKNHSNGSFFKGQRFEVLGTRIITCNTCKKKVFSIDIGIGPRDGHIAVKMQHANDEGCNGHFGIFTENWFSALSFKLVEDGDENILGFKNIKFEKAVNVVQLSES